MIKRNEAIDYLRRRFFPKYFSYDEIYRRISRLKILDNSKILHLGSGCDKSRINGLKTGNFVLVSLDREFGQLRKNTNLVKVLGDAYNLPFKSGSFDLVLSEHFFEHIAEPKLVLSECRRVLKKNSDLVFSLPNKFSYISMFNLYFPKFLKDIAKKLRGLDIEYYQAYYRFNSAKTISDICDSERFKVKALHYYIGPPEYFLFSLPLFAFFTILHKVIELVPLWSHRFHLVFLGILEKR